MSYTTYHSSVVNIVKVTLPLSLQFTLHNYNTGTRDYKSTFSAEALRYAKRHASAPPPPASLEYIQAAKLIMVNNNITQMPKNTSEALYLYIILVSALEMFVY